MVDMGNMGPLPLIHERETLVHKAEMKLREKLLEATGSDEFKELTSAEYLKVINIVFSDKIASFLKFAIRKERHGNTDDPGGWA